MMPAPSVRLVLAALALAAPGSASHAEMRHLPIERMANDAPDALPVGIRFHSSVSQDNRRLVIQDLTWLSNLGPLGGTSRLSRAIGLGEGDASGAQLAAWIIGTIKVIGDIGGCPSEKQVIVSGLQAGKGIKLWPARSQGCRVTRDDLARVVGSTSSSLHAVNGGLRLWRQADSEEADGFVVDGYVVVSPSRNSLSPPIVVVNFDAHAAEGTPALSRVERLTTLAHEAMHVNDGGHGTCGGATWTSREAAPFGGLRTLAPGTDCDETLQGAYAVGAMVLGALAAGCRDCTARETYTIKARESASWMRLMARARTTVAVSGPMAGRYAMVPARPYFASLLEYAALRRQACDAAGCREMATRWATEVSATMAELASAESGGAFATPWSAPRLHPVSRKAPDVAGAGAWLRAASQARAAGYNVALREVPPCSRFPGGCP